MAFLIVAWFVVTIIYIVVRATKSLHLGAATAYGVWVLIMEVSPPPPPHPLPNPCLSLLPMLHCLQPAQVSHKVDGICNNATDANDHNVTLFVMSCTSLVCFDIGMMRRPE